MKRTIIIGDVHGCNDELQDLLKTLQAGPADNLISVGDLICKGPDSLGVMNWAMSTPNLEIVIGNHEARFLDCWRRGVVPEIKPYDLDTYQQLSSRYEECMRFIESWPFYISKTEYLVVHAGIDPRRSLSQQKPDDLVNLRRIGTPGMPWYELYEEKRLIVFGHWAGQEPVVRPNAIGLDTGCVYGGRLTALVLPERRLVSVQARRAYRKKSVS